jgi:hypothetical protein
MICPSCNRKLTIRKLEKGATYALECDDIFSADQIEKIRAHVATLKLGIKILIVEAGMKLKLKAVKS